MLKVIARAARHKDTARLISGIVVAGVAAGAAVTLYCAACGNLAFG